MDLNTFWFILITVLFAGFFFLEGFDYGVGILLPFVAKKDVEKRIVINSIGPFWDGNEVWLLTAGGAMFAAFPNWYATLFSGFYLPLFLILLALIVRGVGFEFRSKSENKQWRKTWDNMIFIGSALPALLWGVAIGNIIRGVPIDAKMTYVGGFFNLLNPFSLLVGITFLLLFSLHGALYLRLRTTGEVLDRANSVVRNLLIPTIVVAVAFLIYSYFETDLFTGGAISWIVSLLPAVFLLLSAFFIIRKCDIKAFIMTSLTIVLTTVAAFVSLFPRVMISSLSSEWNLTIYNASSSPYTLKVMSIIAIIFVPIVLIYQGWTYKVFRKRITADTLEY